ncbi:hypothetical protein LSH36_102g08008 [Paralvinella palmiformis]|uniref:Uncharacterized protein n=1 Tax=Paralvinella palmiformis TaxID=53620 RepID=A0AAD9K1I5_9ANNE|nr:hypothetical protein LSH36_102g08008 [Paralvinella palmiformis]
MQNCYGKKEQNDRLTTKHIHTLKFLQEIVAENKQLKERIDELECDDTTSLIEENKARIKEIQEQYMKRADEINIMLTEKHKEELMKRVEEQLEAEKLYKETRQQLQAEIDRQRKIISDLEQQLGVAKENDNHVEIYKLKVAALEQEIGRLQQDREKLEAKNRGNVDQLGKLDLYEEQNKSLKDQLSASSQKIKELEFKIRNLERDLSQQGVSEQDEILVALKNKLEKMHKDRTVCEEREKDFQNLIDDLKDENGKLRRALDDSERMRLEMRAQMEHLLSELATLRKQTVADRDRQTFKDFVQVKRELASVKEENDELRMRMKFSTGRDKDLVLPNLRGADPRNGVYTRIGSTKSDRRKSDTPTSRNKYL